MTDSAPPTGGVGSPPSIIVCYTKCWPCNFQQHSPKWHTWADFEDVEHAKSTGQPDPSDQRCGCYCCDGTVRPAGDA